MKLSMLLSAVVLVCGAAASRAAAPAAAPAAAACAAPALAQLLSAAPGGAVALREIAAAVPAPAPRTEEASASAAEPAASPADAYIEHMAVAAFKAGRYASARLLLRLSREGTRAEKLAFVSAGRKPYSFPERFYWKTGVVMADAPVCHFVTETFCTVSCWGTGDNQQQCREDCRNIIVKSCD